MTDRPERVAIATAARPRMEGVRIVLRATAAERARSVHGQELWQLETEPKSKRQLIMSRTRRRVRRHGKDTQPRACMKASSRVHTRAVACIGLKLQHLQPLFCVTTLRKCML